MTHLQNIPCPLRRISQPPPHIVISSPSFCKVDPGEGSLRTVVSGLVPHVPIERMQGLVGIFVCNLTPVKMRGIESQVMLMCTADTNDRVEPLFIESPIALMLDGRVCVQNYPAQLILLFWVLLFDEPNAQLHHKRKVWKQVMPDLRREGSQIATYKGVPWKLRNSPDAVIRAPTVVDAQIS
ncbi:unnamed protein product [Taenia asiatica]|uniref:tRNA-binding domain-containing protein n=1 Tax=Taenia asiatica TaxID=60517 RepID=A0A3P6R0U1_TAEAS|nr:unnamed protein product [Taenia asiatica]